MSGSTRPGGAEQREGGHERSGRLPTGDARELAVPVPFTMEEFAARLKERTGRPAELVPLVMGPGAPSGIFLRKERADYLCYEQETSPFHQAHIIVSLAAHAIAGKTAGEAAGQRLLPDPSPRLLRIMLGGDASTMTWAEAEAFAYQTLGRSGLADCPPGLARHLARQLRPLHTALAAAVSEQAASAVCACRSAEGAGHDPGFSLHQMVIGIREALLALRPVPNLGGTAATSPAGRLVGLTGGDLATKTAAALVAAVRKSHDRDRSERPAEDRDRQSTGGRDLRGEAEWLTKVAQEFGELPLAGD